MRFKIFKFKKVTSTNNTAINLIKNRKVKIGCIYADRQSRGRGTKGNVWISDIGNLFISIFFPLKKNYPPFSEFSMINPIIISKVIRVFCKKKKISFKWPNDILVNEKKICGILQEVITLKKKKFLIIGIGINLVSNPIIKNNYKTTSIFLETRKKPNIKIFTKLLISSYENFFNSLKIYKFINFKKNIELMSVK